VELAAGLECRGLELHLSPGGQLEVRVLTAGGSPLVGAPVLCQPQAGAILEHLRHTDGDGVTTTRALPPGTYRVVAWSPGVGHGWVEGVQVTGEGSGTCTVTLDGATGALNLEVHRGGRPVQGTTLQLLDARGMPVPDLRDSGGLAHLHPQGAGVYDTARFPAGPYTLRLRQGDAILAERPVELPGDGSTVSVVLDLD
jgi:hypothetical protein